MKRIFNIVNASLGLLLLLPVIALATLVVRSKSGSPIFFNQPRSVLNGDVMMTRSMLQLLVPEYQPDEKVVDWVYWEQIAQSGVTI